MIAERMLIIGFAMLSMAWPMREVHSQTLSVTPPLHSAPVSLHYAFDAETFGSVFMKPTEQGWVLGVREEPFDLPAKGRLWENKRLWPAQHPIGKDLARLRALRAEANGFTVVMDYTVSSLTETYALTFEHLRSSDTNSCPVKLIRYRHEQRHLNGDLRAGLVADFHQGMARFLAIDGQPSATPRLAVRLLPRNTCLTELPSVFEEIPALDVPRFR